MKKAVILLCAVLCLVATSEGQILNIDKNEVGEKEQKWLVNTNLTLSSDQQKYNVLDVFFVGDVSYKYKRRRYVFYGKIDRLTDGNQKIQDAGCFQLRNRIGIKKKWSADYFVQHQWNGAWGMVDRNLAGINVIQQWVNNDSIDFFTGFGVFYERETWNYSAVTQEKIPPNPIDILVEHPRLNLTAKYSRTFKNHMDLVTRIFNQSTIYQNILISRSSFAAQLNIPISKKLAFATNFELAYDTHPIVPIRNFLYSFAQTITLSL